MKYENAENKILVWFEYYFILILLTYKRISYKIDNNFLDLILYILYNNHNNPFYSIFCDFYLYLDLDLDLESFKIGFSIGWKTF